MATTIVTKNSSTASAVPTAAQLVQGELAVNVADKKLYTEDNAGSIIVLADGVKLDGIEALADVTDTANVTAAGALMDSELTNITAVKALNQGVATTDSPSFVGLTASGEIAANGGIALGDNDKATFGDSDDLQIYHDGSNSYIEDAGAGVLFIKGTGGVYLRGKDSDEDLGRFLENGAVDLYYDGSSKLATTSTGIDVTGQINASTNLVAGTSVYSNNGVYYGSSTLSLKNSSAGSFVDFASNGNATFFGTATMDGLTSQLTADAQGKFSGWSPTGSTSTAHGAIELGSIASYQGIIAYDGSSNTRFLFDNSWSGTGSTFEFRTNTAATAKTHLKVEGTGDISFYEDTGTTAKLFWDASAESLGIGTSSPVRKIHSEGTGVLFANTGGTHEVLFGDNAYRYFSLFTPASPEYMSIRTGSTDLLTVKADGNVGIAGQTNPTYKLDGGFVNQTWGWYLTDSYNAGFTYNTAERSLLIHTKSADVIDHIKFATGGSATERFRIASDGSLSTPTLGTSNVRFGVNAGNSIIAGGNYNVLVGDEAGTAITTGDYNTALGYQAGASVTTGPNNTLMGGTAGLNLTTGGENVAIGYGALYTDDVGSHSTAVGVSALQNQNYASATDSYNTAVGFSAGLSVTTGVQNTLIGGLAGDALTEGFGNVALGYSALSSDTLGKRSVAIGHQTLLNQNFTSVTDAFNTAVGHEAGKSVTTGTNNTLIGGLAGDAITTASNNSALGFNSFSANTTGENNVALGSYALNQNTTAFNNTAVGHFALTANTTGTYNVAVGANALDANTTGARNAGIGQSALGANTTASDNIAMGYSALGVNTTGGNNVAVGNYALDANTTAANNTAVGYNALTANTTGVENVAVGANALEAVTTGYENIGVGRGAGSGITTGSRNTFIGDDAGYNITTGNNNTILGRFTGANGGLDISTASNYIVLSDGDGNPRGIFDGSGNFLVGTASPAAKLTVEQASANANGAAIKNQTVDYQTLGLHNAATSGDNFLVSFVTDASSFRGSIAYNRAGGLIAYNTTSDYRAKDISGPVTDSGVLIDSTPVYMGKMKGATQERPMFIAHEVPAYAHTGEKDAIDADGNPIYQQMDVSALVPVMWAEIQSLRARVAQLEGA
jgi:hypothetical protein